MAIAESVAESDPGLISLDRVVEVRIGERLVTFGQFESLIIAVRLGADFFDIGGGPAGSTDPDFTPAVAVAVEQCRDIRVSQVIDRLDAVFFRHRLGDAHALESGNAVWIHLDGAFFS